MDKKYSKTLFFYELDKVPEFSPISRESHALFYEYGRVMCYEDYIERDLQRHNDKYRYLTKSLSSTVVLYDDDNELEQIKKTIELCLGFVSWYER